MAGVQPAFGFFPLFPPPAPGPLRFAGRYLAGAWRAANRDEALIVQWVVGNAAVADESHDAIALPVEQRVYFDNPIMGIDARVTHRRALARLAGT